MQAPGYHTRNEIFSQPEAWTATLDTFRGYADELRALWQNGQYDSVVFTGCGSPYYLALTAASMFQEFVGTPARGVPASEIWLNQQAVLPPAGRTLLITLSRSAETTETIRAVETFRAAGRGDVLTLSCYPDRPLATIGDVNLVFPAGQEESMAQTRAFTTLQLAATALVALWANRDDLLEQLQQLPDVCRRILETYSPLMHTLGTDTSINRFYFLGSGARYGLASELSLKMKEMSISHSEPFHVLEFRHGPRAMATDGALIVGLVSESNQAHEQAVLEDMRAQGARSLAIGEHGTDVAFDSGVHEAVRNLLYLPVGQMLAFERALHNGSNPDQPANLAAVVTLK
ncbi:MAG TPA: SIS domain-containing protein [Roseiflexaceae bacterium]|nr:SIS domain-containing protein [Roseiflexaceae bacterium]